MQKPSQHVAGRKPATGKIFSYLSGHPDDLAVLWLVFKVSGISKGSDLPMRSCGRACTVLKRRVLSHKPESKATRSE